MAYMSLVALCFGCGTVFSCNPETVPSYQEQPICEECIRLVNRKRKKAGLPEWPVAANAYEAAEVM